MRLSDFRVNMYMRFLVLIILLIFYAVAYSFLGPYLLSSALSIGILQSLMLLVCAFALYIMPRV